MNDEKWRRAVERDSNRLRQAGHNRRSLLVHTVYLGSLSVMFVAPLLGGAYLGQWLDSRSAGYSVHWTINLLILGLLLGIANVYYFIRKYW